MQFVNKNISVDDAGDQKSVNNPNANTLIIYFPVLSQL